MHSLKKTVLLGAFALVVSIHAAPAADLDLVELREPPAYAGGWYLRGDIGYVVNKAPVADYAAGTVNFLFEDLSNGWMIGGGFGYRHNWFRTDFTVDWRRGDFTGQTPCGCGPNSREWATIDSWTFMWNVYADLGTWAYVTPYVGGGVGFAYNRAHNIYSIDAGGTTYFADGGKWNFAGALMAGVSIAMMDGVVFDTGYRYIWLGDAQSGLDGIGNRIRYRDLQSHEFRVGMRYEY